MLKKTFYYVKKVILAGFTLFVFNLMISPLNVVIPINVVTILFVAVFGIMALPFFTLILVFLF